MRVAVLPRFEIAGRPEMGIGFYGLKRVEIDTERATNRYQGSTLKVIR
jgi:hypothetical protein